MSDKPKAVKNTATSEEGGKKLNLFNIIGLGVGGAIGTGIFVLLGSGIAHTGRSIVLVVAVGCFFMLLAYWYNLAMPMMFVLRGGDYSMKGMLMTPLLTGVSAWFTVINGFAFASYAIAIADYMSVVWPVLADYQAPLAIVITIVFFAISIRGSRLLTIVENWITIVLIVALVLFVGVGIFHVDPAAFFSNSDGGFFYGGFSGFVAAISIMGWACQGTTMAPISMAAVTENPKRTLPVGILIITVVVAVVYAGMAYVASGVLPYDQVAGANISVTAEAIFPTPLYLFFVVGGGICAIASSMLGGIGMVRYPLKQIAEDGWLPAVFKKSTADGYPYITYGVFFIITILPIVLGLSLDEVVSLVMIPTMLMNIYMNLACITLPKKYPEQWAKRSVKIPRWFFNVCSVLGAFCAGVVAYNLFVDLTLTGAITCVAILVIIVVLSIIRLKQGAVSKEILNERREEIIRQAIADDVE